MPLCARNNEMVKKKRKEEVSANSLVLSVSDVHDFYKLFREE